jgi:oligoendopeptidase F
MTHSDSIFMQDAISLVDKGTARKHVPADFSITTWEALKPMFDRLEALEVDTPEQLEAFLAMRNELESVVEEEFAWRYIRMTCDTTDADRQAAYQDFLENILPNVSEIDDSLNRKMAESPFFEALPDEPYLTFRRGILQRIKLFRAENIPLTTEEMTLAREHGTRQGAMTVTHNGQTLTLQQAGRLLEERDRSLRFEVWEKIQKRRLEDLQPLDDLLDKLISLRGQIAQNAGYSGYTQFKFDDLGRFDYTPEDVAQFHTAVEVAVKPVYQRLLEIRRQRLGVDRLRPWDLAVDMFGDQPLHPFKDAAELTAHGIAALRALKPELGDMLALMDREGFLDLDSRVGKAPGGYNYPLMESGVPFIFMNAAGTHNDVITLFHEAGHAIHSFVTRPIPLNALKSTPAEVAELASMSMELLTLDQYGHFYPEAEDLKRAQMTQLEHCITGLPWIATVDAFQQWMYNHPGHTQEERRAAWVQLYYRFHGDLIDWSGYEQALENMWQRQLHIYEVPFYYIEYGIAQLGALAVWKNYREDPVSGLNQYLHALSLGYKKPIGGIYEAAGIRLDFDANYIRESVEYCYSEFERLLNS